jgi:Phage protein Gp138 N-terminal domain
MTKPLLSQMPTVRASLAHALQHSAHQQRLALDNMLPATIVSFDRAHNTATVQPMVSWVDTEDNATIRRSLINIPVLSLGGGGFHISFPLKQGDLGWIHASDRDISNFKKGLAQQGVPSTTRSHEFADGMFIPDVYRQYVINGADTSAMVIQSVDGATRISISNGNVVITAPTAVTVTTPMATFSTNVHVKGTLLVDQQISANGGFNATGGGNLSCVLPQMTTINGITVATHGHQQQNNGSGRTAAGMIV